NVTVEVVMARAPDGTDMFEVVRFHSPAASAQELAPAANRPGLRHVAFKVDDVRGVVDRVRAAGWDTVGEIVDFENTFLLCYVRGPEGLIVAAGWQLDPLRGTCRSASGRRRGAPTGRANAGARDADEAESSTAPRT